MKSFGVLFLLFILSLVSPVQAITSPWKANWIWNDTPRHDNYFRKVITVADTPTKAKVAVTADNVYDLYVNGTKVGSDDDWMDVEVYDITRYIVKGRNIIAVKAVDIDTKIGGLLLEGAITYPGGKALVFGTDGSWKMSGTETPDWTMTGFDDSTWQTPIVIGRPPVGVWGGLDHPVLTPRTPLEIVSVACPKSIKQGRTVAVSVKVKPTASIPFDSPVALQVLVDGEPVCEQWADPDTPTSSWVPGKVRTINFKRFRMPLYVPSGKLQIRLVTNATESRGAADVTVGSPAIRHAKPKISVFDFSVRSLDSGKTLQISAKVVGAPKGSVYLFSLFKGSEMWFAKEISAPVAKVRLPQGFPGGRFTAKLLPYKATCPSSASVEITIPGPASTTMKPLAYDTYVDRDGVPHRWYVNEHGALIWDGRPCVPVGAMFLSRFYGDYRLGATETNEKLFKEDVHRLSMLKKAGVTDVYLNPCAQLKDKPVWVWRRWADICEQVGLRYGIQITNHLRKVKAFNIAQDEYLVPIEGGETAKASIPASADAKKAGINVYYAAFDAKTDGIIETGKAVVTLTETGIVVEATPKAQSGTEINVHFVPEFGDGVYDYWQELDGYRQEAKRFFGHLKLGPNFRLWIDPLDNEQGFGGKPILPSSLEFRSKFAQWLESQYDSTAKLTEAWAIESAGPVDFEAFARLIPLGKPRKDSDVGYALDEQTGRTYEIDLTHSRMWFDMLHFRDMSVTKADNEASDIIKSYHGAPVVLKGTGTNIFTNPVAHGGFDGIGMEAYGAAPELTRGCGGGVYSRCKQSAHTMWTLTTETGLADEHCGYPDPIRLSKELGSMLEMNGKGTFYFILDAPGQPAWALFNLYDDPRQLIWMGAYAELAQNSKLLPDYEPEVDYYFPPVIEGQNNGFAACDPGFHSDSASQSIPGESGKWVVNASNRIPPDAKRVIVNMENTPITTIYGPAFEKARKSYEIVMVGHRKDLGELSVDGYYTDQFVEDSDGTLVQALKPTATSKVFAKTSDGTIYGLTDGTLTIYSKDNWKAAVSKMASKRKNVDFFRDILNLQVMDLGRAFQGMHFGSTTYIWNMLDSANRLALDVPSGAKNVVIQSAGGKKQIVSGSKKVWLTIPPKASVPVIIRNLAEVKIAGVDEANLTAAKHGWNSASKKAKSLGFTPPPMPTTTDWRELFRSLDQLKVRVSDTYDTTTAAYVPGVKVDGDLSEWQEVKPIYMSLDVRADYSLPQDYSGVKFYIGYDENYLYIAGDVNDGTIANNYRLDNLWNGDGIEVFIDLHPEVDPGSRPYNSDCFQFIFTPTSKDGVPAMAVKNPDLPADSVPKHSQWVVAKKDGGWRFEAAINRADINNYRIEPGAKIGFTVQLDNSDGGDRTVTRLWRGRSDTSHNRQGFGRLIFSKEKK